MNSYASRKCYETVPGRARDTTLMYMDGEACAVAGFCSSKENTWGIVCG